MKPSISGKYTEKGMRYPALNSLIAKASNKYELALATAKRARELIDGKEAFVKITIDNPVSIATAEIDQELVKPISVEEQKERTACAKKAESEKTIFPEEADSTVPTTAEIVDELLEDPKADMIDDITLGSPEKPVEIANEMVIDLTDEDLTGLSQSDK